MNFCTMCCWTNIPASAIAKLYNHNNHINNHNNHINNHNNQPMTARSGNFATFS